MSMDIISNSSSMIALHSYIILYTLADDVTPLV